MLAGAKFLLPLHTRSPSLLLTGEAQKDFWVVADTKPQQVLSLILAKLHSAALGCPAPPQSVGTNSETDPCKQSPAEEIFPKPVAKDLGQQQKDKLPHQTVNALPGTSECKEDPEEAPMKGSVQENQW